VLGLGKKKHNHADAWWERAFDSSLKTLDVTNSAAGGVTVVQTQKDGALGLLVKNGSNGVAGTSALYKYFVKGASLAGTVEDGYNKEDLDAVADGKTKKRKRNNDESSTDEDLDKKRKKDKKSKSERKSKAPSGEVEEQKSRKSSKRRKHDKSDDEIKTSESRKSSKDKKDRKSKRSKTSSADTPEFLITATVITTTDDSGIEVTPDVESDTPNKEKNLKTSKRSKKLKDDSRIQDPVVDGISKSKTSDKKDRKEKKKSEKEKKSKEAKDKKKSEKASS